MRRPYEIVVIVRILSSEQEVNDAIDQVVTWIEEDEGGKVTRIDRTTLGRRKLEYEIEKQREGLYIIYYADIEPANLPELELNLKLSSNYLRHLVVRLDEPSTATEA